MTKGLVSLFEKLVLYLFCTKKKKQNWQYSKIDEEVVKID